MRLDEISNARGRAIPRGLVAKLGDKRINNILAVLSKPMKYAVDCEVIDKSRASACSNARQTGYASAR